MTLDNNDISILSILLLKVYSYNNNYYRYQRQQWIQISQILLSLNIHFNVHNHLHTITPQLSQTTRPIHTKIVPHLVCLSMTCPQVLRAPVNFSLSSNYDEICHARLCNPAGYLLNILSTDFYFFMFTPLNDKLLCFTRQLLISKCLRLDEPSPVA